MVKKDTTDTIMELSAAEFDKLPEAEGGKIDYDDVWDLIKGKILTNAGLTKAVNIVRKQNGFVERDFYWSEKKRVFDVWTRRGHTIEKRYAYVGKKRLSVYRFIE